MGTCISVFSDINNKNDKNVDKKNEDSNNEIVKVEEVFVKQDSNNEIVKVEEVFVKQDEISNKFCVGAGCYWGTEKFYRKVFKSKDRWGNVVDGKVGFMGPKDAKVNPTYKEVCSGETGHVEVFYLEYEGGEFVYEELCKFLFRFTDPTTLNRSGNDIGTQYASVIYCYDKKQMEIAKKVIFEVQDMLNKGLITCWENREIVTEIKEATIFYPAHEEHQLYLEKNPKGYCNHKLNRLEL